MLGGENLPFVHVSDGIAKLLRDVRIRFVQLIRRLLQRLAELLGLFLQFLLLLTRLLRILLRYRRLLFFEFARLVGGVHLPLAQIAGLLP